MARCPVDGDCGFRLRAGPRVERAWWFGCTGTQQPIPPQQPPPLTTFPTACFHTPPPCPPPSWLKPATTSTTCGTSSPSRAPATHCGASRHPRVRAVNPCPTRSRTPAKSGRPEPEPRAASASARAGARTRQRQRRRRRQPHRHPCHPSRRRSRCTASAGSRTWCASNFDGRPPHTRTHTPPSPHTHTHTHTHTRTRPVHVVSTTCHATRARARPPFSVAQPHKRRSETISPRHAPRHGAHSLTGQHISAGCHARAQAGTQRQSLAVFPL